MFSVPDATLESSPNCRGFSFPTNIPSAAVFNHAGGKCYALYQSRSKVYTQAFYLKWSWTIKIEAARPGSGRM